jgi:PleD family two-component response regulator
MKIEAVPPISGEKTQFDFNDPVFRKVTDTLLARMRSSDTLGRLDAGTFALVMPHTGAGQADVILRRLRHLLKEAGIATPKNHWTLQASLVHLDPKSDETGHRLLDRAEALLRTPPPGPD